MRVILLMMLLPTLAQAAEHDHAAMSAVAEPAQALHEHAARSPANDTVTVEGPDISAVVHEHGGMWQHLVLFDRLEQQIRNGEDALQWRGDVWVGSDTNKLWLKTEGSWLEDRHETHDAETQILFSHAIAPFWDLQSGLIHSEARTTTDYASVGVQGLAPYWFHVEAALLVGEDQRLAHFEAEYDLRLTQRLILKPRLQLRYAFDEDRLAGIGRGLSESSIGLRLRYEVLREFAPYIGVEQDIGPVRQADDLRLVAGIRVWY